MVLLLVAPIPFKTFPLILIALFMIFMIFDQLIHVKSEQIVNELHELVLPLVALLLIFVRPDEKVHFLLFFIPPLSLIHFCKILLTMQVFQIYAPPNLVN